jgi:hypothetical protein
MPPKVEKPPEEEAPSEPEMPPEAEEPVVPKKPAEVEKPPKPEKPEAAPPAKKKKINKMTLAEIETKLEEVKIKMGGLDSKYAQHLILRKNYLNSLK